MQYAQLQGAFGGAGSGGAGSGGAGSGGSFFLDGLLLLLCDGFLLVGLVLCDGFLLVVPALPHRPRSHGLGIVAGSPWHSLLAPEANQPLD